MITIPEVDTTVLPARTVGRDQRTLSTDIPTSDPMVVLEVSTFHHRDRRQYVTHVRGVRLTDESAGGRTVTIRSFSLMDFGTLQVIGAGARFSARNLHDAHTAAMAQVDTLLVVDPEPLRELVWQGVRLSS